MTLVRGDGDRERRPGPLSHDRNCPQCGGRGHVATPPADMGWKRVGPRQYEVPSGGVHTFLAAQPETVMRLCECVKERGA